MNVQQFMLDVWQRSPRIFLSHANRGRIGSPFVVLSRAFWILFLFAGLAQAKPPQPDLAALAPVGPALVKMRAVTQGPKYHWFGYYNKAQIDPTGRYLLAHEVDFEHRLPKADDIVKIGMVDLENGDRWIELGQSRAWSWQQGSMLQWRPGSESEIVYNDLEGDHYICRILDIKTGKIRTLPQPIEHITADGKRAICADFRRIQYIRAGYGYACLPDPNRNVAAPDDTGIWSMDLDTGETKFIVSVAQIAKIPYPDAKLNDLHYLNHLEWSTDGKRFLMFDRWTGNSKGMPTRVFTAAADGSDVRLLSARGASHWVWRDPEHVVIWGLGGYKFYKDDGSGEPKETFWLAPNGHESIVPGTNLQWIVTDTYPQGPKREQILYLYHLPTNRAVVLGKFPSPKEYRSEWRCDLHPRVTRDGKRVIIDSPHGGNGRQQYLFDISRIIAGGIPPVKTEIPPPEITAPNAIPAKNTESSAPRTLEETQQRMAELRRHYAPYLRSLPEPLVVRVTTPLRSTWRTKFEIEKATSSERPAPPECYREDYDDSQWAETTVPEWRYAALGTRESISCILWYRTRFSAKVSPPQAPEPRTYLVFEGVDWEAEVWLNGKKLGNHAVYYEPFRFDVTGLLREQNTLAVRVIDGPLFGEPRAYWSLFPLVPAEEQRYVRDRRQSIPGFKNDDLHIGSGFGIHRDVYLETTGPTRIAEVFARNDPDRQRATITVETDSAAAKRMTFDVQLLPENFEGRSFRLEISANVPQGEGKQIIEVPMPGAKLWTPETPNLYRCRVICRMEGAAAAIADAKDVLFGCRTFELVSKQRPHEGLPEGSFLFNGKPFHLRGTNIQGLNALWYWNETDRIIDILLMLKVANFNAVRSCQHVEYPEVLELLDRLGVLSEQDQGGGRSSYELKKNLPRAGAALARTCYNNPGVVLLSFANETHFDPTPVIETVHKVDPQRILVPISGNYYPQNAPVYSFAPELWENVVQDWHTYPGWRSNTPGAIWKLSSLYTAGGKVVRRIDRAMTLGEYGAEALDSYETMTKNYPAHFRPTPPADADRLWGAVQVEKADNKQIIGFRGRKPANLGEYITASQNYQADVLAEQTKGLRLLPRAISGYFQFHFIDVMPANWPKSIVSHDLVPKKAYYAMAQANQALVPLFQLNDRGDNMELWVANDLPEAFSKCRLRWTVETAEKALLDGEKTLDVPALDAVQRGKVNLSSVPRDTDLVLIRLTLSDSSGKLLSSYEQEIFLRAWREQGDLFESVKDRAAK